jgi:hypothetical protein
VSEKLLGPFTVDVKVHIANDEDGTIGAATVGLAPGKVPTLEAFHRAIGQTLAAMPDGYRLLTGGEFFNQVLVKEKTGRRGNFAVPASFNYDVDALTEAGRAACPEADEPDEDGPEDDEDE